MYTKEELQKAKKRVQAKKAFYQHMIAFAIVNGFLILLNLITSPSYFWFVFPLLGWGIGLAFHYVDVFGIPGFDILSKEWEEQQIERELQKSRTNRAGKDVLEDHEKTEEPKQMELKELSNRYDDTNFV